MTIKDGQQMKVIMPGHLFAALQSEAKDTAMPMANLVRLAVQQRYERKRDPQAAALQQLRVLGQACALDLMSPEKALEQLTAIVFEMPVPYVITEAGEAALSP
jgi:hypothetical protein